MKTMVIDVFTIDLVPLLHLNARGTILAAIGRAVATAAKKESCPLELRRLGEQRAF